MGDWFRDMNAVLRGNRAIEIGLDRFLHDQLSLRPLRMEAAKLKRRYRPRLHPTKGYRGAHKLFRGGSR